MNINGYKSIFENSLLPIGCHKIICNKEGRPEDYEFVAVNHAYEMQTGLKAKAIIGKRITELYPHIKLGAFDWIDTYSRVAINGTSEEFSRFFDAVHEYNTLKIYSPQKNYFITMFCDIIASGDREDLTIKETLNINDLIDVPELQSVVDEFNKITNIAMAIGNKDGQLVVQSGFQDICKNFHRANPKSCANCTKSDMKLFAGATSGKHMKYKCLNNMWDISTPIILDGKTVGAIYLGQFIYDDDAIDYEVFKAQAKRYGYDEKAYLEALSKVPRMSHQAIENIMNFYIKFANVVALLGYKNSKIQAAKTKQELLILSLLASEKRFASTINCIPGAILIFDRDLKIQYANDAISKISGKEAFYHIGKGAEEIWGKDSLTPYVSALKNALKTQTNQFIDIDVPYPDNAYRNFHVSFIPSVKDGMDIEILGIIHEYTEQKQMADAKIFQDNLIRDMGEVAKIGGWEFDVASGKGSWTEEVAKIHGLEPMGETTLALGVSFYTGESKIRIDRAIKTAIEQAIPYDIELELTTANGVKKWVRTIGQPTVSDGKVVRVHGSFQDVTTQKENEQLIKDSETRYQNLFESAPVGVAVSSEEKLIFINPAGLEVLGATSNDQVIGKSLLDFFMPGESENPIKKMLSGKKGAMPVESTCLRLDGTSVPIEVRAISFNHHGMSAAQVIFSDITTRKNAQQAIEQLNIELEQKVEARTRQLLDANTELDTFTYSVSHDLKAPLRGIDGYSKLLLEEFEDQLNQDGQFFLSSIRQSVTRMNQLIDDLLAFSQIERRQFQNVAVDLQKVVNELIDELADDFLAGGGVIKTDLHNITMKTSLEGLSIALKNLIENAIKYSSAPEKALIEISAEENETRILIKVSDNGIGFDMKYHDKIFNIFERLHRVEDYPGTGIGLAIVKRVAGRLHGNVWAISKLGSGSTFYFEIVKEL